MEEVLAALAERRKLVEPLLKEARAGIIEDEKSNGSGHVERPKKNKTLRTLDPVWNKINGPAFEVMETVLTEGSVSITKGRAKVHVTTQDKSAVSLSFCVKKSTLTIFSAHRHSHLTSLDRQIHLPLLVSDFRY